MHINQKIKIQVQEVVELQGVDKKSMDCSLTVNDMSPPLAACSDTTPEGQQPQSAIGDDSRSQPPSVTWESQVSSPSSPPGAPLNVTSGLKLSEAAEVARVALHTSCQSLAFADVEDIAKKQNHKSTCPQIFKHIAQLYVTKSVQHM